MEFSGHAESHVDPSGTCLGFPLGVVLILIVIFSFCGIFSCCYHWEMLTSPSYSFSDDSVDPEAADRLSSSSKSNPDYKDILQNKRQSLPVVMPGDEIPKFIALPCPCEPSRPEKIIIKHVKNPPKPLLVPLHSFQIHHHSS